MRVTIVGLAWALVGTSAWAAAAPPAPPVKPLLTDQATVVSQAEISALIAKAPSLGAPGQNNISQTMVRLPPYNLNLEFRPIANGAVAHRGEAAEMFFVVNGSGELTTGGTIIPASAPGGLAQIEGGASRKIGKGDIALVPGGMPHQFTSTDGSLAVVAIHLPQVAPAP